MNPSHLLRRPVNLPRSKEALGVLRGDPSAARSGAPSWLAAATAIGLAASPSVASADEGLVELANGGRVRGELIAVLPSDRVIVVLPDGTSMSIPWTEIHAVIDGDRAYDAQGTMSARTPDPAPPAAPPQVYVPAPPASPSPMNVLAPRTTLFDPRLGGVDDAERMRALAIYQRLPRRGGAIALNTFGSLMLAQGVILVGFGGAIAGSSDSYYSGGDFSRAFFIPGSISLGLGAFMLGFGIRKLRVRNRGIDELRGLGYFVAGLHDSLSLSFDAGVAQGTFVPRVSLRF